MPMTEMGFNCTEIPDFDGNRTVLEIDQNAFFIINGPLVILNLIANIFFVFCLMAPKTQPLKQPLALLLGSLVSFTILYLFSVTLMICIFKELTSFVVEDISGTIVEFILRVTRNSYVWLMFYYYIMIVPFQRALFLWFKDNIKSVIYFVMLLDVFIFLGDASFQIYVSLDHSRYSNGTFDYANNMMDIVAYGTVTIYIFICLFVMMISCFATAYYLNKHMKRLAASDGSPMNPRLDTHIRVTLTGLLQGLLCFLFVLLGLVDVSFLYLSPCFYFDFDITVTVTVLYTTGTTVNLGVGQTLFRERVIRVWRSVKKRLCNSDSSKDLRPPGRQLESSIESCVVENAVSLCLR